MAVKLRLFISSFAPLFGLLALRFEAPRLWVPLAVLAVLGVFALRGLLKARSGVMPNPRLFVNVRDEGGQVAGYLASYILPLLVIATPNWRDVAAYATFLAVFALVFVSSDLIQVNPLLYLARHRLFAAEDATTGGTFYLVVPRHRGRPASGSLNVTDIHGNLLLVR